MSWKTCIICEESEVISASDDVKSQPQKTVNYHESSATRQFRVTIVTKCQENSESLESIKLAENSANSELKEKAVNFYVDLSELVIICPYFQKFDGLSFVEISTNCTSTWVSAPKDVASAHEDCHHAHTSPINPRHFHAFLDSACPSLYGIRPAPITMESIIPVLDMLSHFHNEPLLTNCERFLMSTNISQLDGNLLIQLLDKGLCVSLDHRILGRILCVCLMNTSAKMSDVSQELTGTVGSVFAQAFVANVSKSFRHIKPLEQENSLWPIAMRHLMIPTSTNTTKEETTNSNEKKKKNNKGNQKRQGCDHTEESFECILCFDQRCGKCKGEAAFCYKALDNFLYEVRLQLYPHTYRPHLDRDLLREDRLSDYILRHQLQPLPEI